MERARSRRHMLPIALGFASALAGTVHPALSDTWHLNNLSDAKSGDTRAIADLEGAQGDLLVKCDAAGPDAMYVQVITNGFFGGKDLDYDFRYLVYQFDTSTPVAGTWAYKDKTASLIRPTDVDKFVAGLMLSKTVTVRATTFGHEDVDLAFDLTTDKHSVIDAYKACGATLPDPSAAGRPAPITSLNWIRLPSAIELRSDAPARALQMRQNGSVSLNCKAQISGILTACRVISESPPGFDFGSAALTVVSQGRYKLSPPSSDQVGAEITFTVPFRLR